MTDAELDLEKSMEPIYEQIERNLVYSNNPCFLTKKNVKTFIFYRDKVKMAEMKEAVKLARSTTKLSH
jgi:hypothetical protein